MFICGRTGWKPILRSYYTPAVANHLPTSVLKELLAELARQAFDRCQQAATCSDELPAITRTFCSPAMRQLHGLLRGWLESAGMSCWLDAAGNLRGRLPCGVSSTAPALLIGSHLDTVPNGGRYDGLLGAVLGIALVEAVTRGGLQLPFAIEVIGFSEEEGVRFGTPFIGSRAIAGDVDEALLNVVDANGVSVRTALENFGCNPAEVATTEIDPDQVIGFLEPHIEQGPVLQAENRPLAVVSAIAGQTRAAVRFVGAAGHAGTTPMHLRRDALAAAAEWITLVERTAQQTPGLVATVGVIEALPGAGNVIPAETKVRLDIRHADDQVRLTAIQNLRARGAELADRRQVAFHFDLLHEHGAVAMDESLTLLLELCLPADSNAYPRLVSGAGHDAAVMARRFPTAMLFIRCQDGISHHPDEFVTLEDVTKALLAMWHFVRQFAAVNKEQ